MSKVVALTTIDNPFDPFDQFREWLSFDNHNDYGCNQLLDRFSFTSDAMTDQEYVAELERAIDEIIEHDVEGVYKKIVRDVEDENEKLNDSYA